MVVPSAGCEVGKHVEFNSNCNPSNPFPYTGCSHNGCNDNTTLLDRAEGRPNSEGLDYETYAKSQALKASGVEIYIVGFGVCPGSIPANDTALCDTTIIGVVGNASKYADDNADRNLLKCLASSTANTNDHYFEQPDASKLPSVFQNIARQIAHRLTE